MPGCSVPFSIGFTTPNTVRRPKCWFFVALNLRWCSERRLDSLGGEAPRGFFGSVVSVDDRGVQCAVDPRPQAPPVAPHRPRIPNRPARSFDLTSSSLASLILSEVGSSSVRSASVDDPIDVLPQQGLQTLGLHGAKPLSSRTVRRRWRAVNSRDFTVFSGTPTSSLISLVAEAQDVFENDDDPMIGSEARAGRVRGTRRTRWRRRRSSGFESVRWASASMAARGRRFSTSLSAWLHVIR